MHKYVYNFQEGNKDMKELLGGKGANLAEMTKIGLPVPQGFTVTTEACNHYYENDEKLGEDIKSQILDALHYLEQFTHKKFGDPSTPLLLSVRSGARASMPGMMDTVLNLGLNDEVALKYSEVTQNKRFVYDSYRRLIQMYADVVKGYSKSAFERRLDEIKKAKSIQYDIDLDAEDMVNITADFKKIYREMANEEFPQDPIRQLLDTVAAVFRSWNNERAIYYRRMNDIPSSWGTAVNVQEMVYGNRGKNSGTGVAFTRNPATGENEIYGEYLMNAQGEDVVAGIRTPSPISKLATDLPEIYAEFKRLAKKLEDHYRDMQDMEFTIDNGKLYMLQTRNGKRTPAAAIKIAVDLVKEGKITKEEALLNVDPKSLDALLHPVFNSQSLGEAKVIATGLAASPGAAAGHIYFLAKEAIEAHKNGEKVVLVRLETSPEDIEGMHHAEGILTIRGGMTSHAAVVARGMGACCVSGCGELTINEEEKWIKTKDGEMFYEKDPISLDGATGKVYAGLIATEIPSISGDFETFMSWADAARKLKVRTNADNPKDALQAKKFGAEGIGLCRTEHMFFEPERIFNFRKMIMATSVEEREKALAAILPYQKEDFIKLYQAMAPNPVVIRYLDPPLHEFLPKNEDEIEKLAESLHVSVQTIKDRIASLKEFNPMMGHRGCRLAITYPEIAKMQTRAVIEAALEVQKQGLKVEPEIMIPLVGTVKEFTYVKEIVETTAQEIIEKSGQSLKYQVGTMIELPRAALIADKIAEHADFFSFGTNDLTQMTFGFSRDDAGKFLNEYYDKQILEQDPFAKLDQEGVGELVSLAAQRGRKTNPNISLGVCGEHGGDPSSIEFCHLVGLDYVSCSPFRVPIARLAAAQAAIKARQN